MNLWNKQELQEALQGEILHSNIAENLQIDEVVIDSRAPVKNAAFIALVGENKDGHNFIEQAITNGCKLLIISKEVKVSENISTILVKDTFAALYKLAEFSRKRSKAKIIAITGSVGKTGTKEMLKNAFETQGKTFATFGNLNNHFGVPLSLCNFARDCAFGIFEMGMNHLGEIEPLSKLTRPHLAIITNVGPVHIEFFKNEEEIALAKSEIFSGLSKDGFALINADNPHFDFLQKQAKEKSNNVISFGEKNSASYQIKSRHILDVMRCQVIAKLKNNQEISYEIATSSEAIIFNSIIAVACLDLLGNDLARGVASFKKLQNEKGRGKIHQIKLHEKNITIIDDSYNASLLSMKAGITQAINLKNILHKNRVIAALGDMLELGEKSDAIHKEVLQFVKEQKVDFAILVGEKMSENAKILPANSYKNFQTSDQVKTVISDLLQDGDILYIKGSRGIKMETLISNLIS